MNMKKNGSSCVAARPSGYTRFEMDGFIYYQQGRKCGKKNCQCASGKLHGPYWYRRSTKSGRVHYVGKNLELGIVRAFEARLKNEEKIIEKRLKMIDEYEALGRLLAGESLSASDCKIICDFGLKRCLVS